MQENASLSHLVQPKPFISWNSLKLQKSIRKALKLFGVSFALKRIMLKGLKYLQLQISQVHSFSINFPTSLEMTAFWLLLQIGIWCWNWGDSLGTATTSGLTLARTLCCMPHQTSNLSDKTFDILLRDVVQGTGLLTRKILVLGRHPPPAGIKSLLTILKWGTSLFKCSPLVTVEENFWTMGHSVRWILLLGILTSHFSCQWQHLFTYSKITPLACILKSLHTLFSGSKN